MSLNRFAVTHAFSAWSPGDRGCPERKVCISPGPKHLFTEQADAAGQFVKFLKNGSWFEAERSEFARSTALLRESQEGAALSARRGA
jgi:hypothetical protein